jgi:hypothetical protein
MKKIIIIAMVFIASLNTKAQTQIDSCGSLGWSQSPIQGLSITLDTSGAGTSSYGVDSVAVIWTACNSTQCYTAPAGMTGYFPQVSLSDTLKVCFDVWFYSTTLGGTQFWETCNQCDSLIYDGTSWVIFSSQDNPTFIMEYDGIGQMLDNNRYDIVGRLITDVTFGKMYIHNNKKYIIIK